MALRMFELAQWRIAVSITALERLLAKPPPPPPLSPTPPIKPEFSKRALPQRKLRKDFNSF
jgi:hypothetical protein